MILGAMIMTKTRKNHYVPEWHQKGFIDKEENKLCYLTRQNINLPNGETKSIYSKKWYTPAQRFYGVDLYSTFFGTEVNDEVEQKLFGPIDDNGSIAVRGFLINDQSEWHKNFQNFFTYLDAQKLRTPKGLDWIKSKYSELSQLQLMIEMQSLRSMHCTLWAEGIRELVSAEDSDVKFIVSDHPVTVYNYACPPESELCEYPNDPDIALKGSQTIFPLDKNRCLILTNLEYAKDPENINPLEQRTNSTRIRRSMVNTIEFINNRKLNKDEVTKINHIIKRRAQLSIAAGREEWLFPEDVVTCGWSDIRHILLPNSCKIQRYGGEIYAQFEDGSFHYQDAYGRTIPQNEYLNKSIDESKIGRNDLCGCGSGRKYKNCCNNIPVNLRITWNTMSIRERNLAFCNCIRDTLGLDSGKTWPDIKRELSNEQISKIYSFYSVLWPRESDIYSLLPKSDGKFRGLYTGPLDVRVIGVNALPLASAFDELLIETPIINPNNTKPEFSPTKSPGKYKYQALKDFLFMLEMEPYIGLGFVNLIPDPREFDLHLMRATMEMARGRYQTEEIICEQDYRLHFKLCIDDLLNSIAMLPRNVKIQTLVQELKLTEEIAAETIAELERNAEASPLIMMQQLNPGEQGQYIHFRMGPNYEMAMLIAQVTGSVLITDSISRWQEFVSAQHRAQGFVNYPWNTALDQLNLIPIDYQFVKTYEKSQSHFAKARNLMKSIDSLVFSNERNEAKLSHLARQAKSLNDQLGRIENDLCVTRKLKILSPDGGFYDSNVQRLLARSSCQKYDHLVRSVYGIDCI
jgi:hypothetical protein